MDGPGIGALEAVLSRENAAPADILRAADIAGKYGLGEPTKLSNPEFASMVAEVAIPFFEGREEEYKEFVEALARRVGQ
jgi:hypothetical protein